MQNLKAVPLPLSKYCSLMYDLAKYLCVIHKHVPPPFTFPLIATTENI